MLELILVTAIAVFFTFRLVRRCASHSSAQALSVGCLTIAVNGASCTNRNGMSAFFQSSRQFSIIAGNSV